MQLPIQRTFGDARFHADGDLVALAYADDGTLWSVEEPGVLRQWNAASGRPVRQHALSDLETLWCFSSGGKMLASASDDLSLWDVVSGNRLAAIPQSSWVTSVAFAHDLSLLATGHDDGVVRIWDVASRQLLRGMAAHQRPISALAWSVDMKRLASAGEDRLIHLWETGTGHCAATLEGHTDRIPALAWHPQGRYLVSAGWDTTARVWDATHKEAVILLNSHADQVSLLAFSPNGRTLACADSENTIHLWNTITWQTQHRLHNHDEIRCLSFNPNSRFLASGGAERLIHLWDVQRGELRSDSVSPSRNAIAVSCSSQGLRLTSNCGGTGFRLWEPHSGKLVAGDGQAGIPAVSASPDGCWLATGGSDTRVHLRQAATGQPFCSLMGQKGPVAALAFSPKSDLLASASASDGTVWLWNIAKAEPALLVIEAADGCTVETVAFHPEGRWLACGGIDWLATGGSDGAICLWDIHQPSKVALFEHGTTSLAFHPSGKWLAAASLQEVIYLWDVATRELVAELGGHPEGINCIAFSPDGGWLASGSSDRTLRLWKVDSRQLVAAHDLDTPLQSLGFSPDSRSLFTGNGNTTCFQLEVARLVED